MNTFAKNFIAISFIFTLVSPGFALAAISAVNLGSADNFAILAKSGISNTGATRITGDVGVSPATASSVTGFNTMMDTSNKFSISPLVLGRLYASDYAPLAQTIMTAAINDMESAYTDAAERRNPREEKKGARDIGGLTFPPGLYKWDTEVIIRSDITLSGGTDDIWIFQIDGNLQTDSGVKINFLDGAQAKNIFWQVTGQTTLGSQSVFSGNILSKGAIALNAGANLNGRALSQATIILNANIVTGLSSTSPITVPTETASTVAKSALMVPAVFPQEAHTPPTPVVVAKTTTIPTPFIFGQQVRTIAINLTLGNRGKSVTALQEFLISQNKGPATQTLMKNGATNYFGTLTRSALMEFQKSVGITPASGYFGPITRAYLSNHNQ